MKKTILIILTAAVIAAAALIGYEAGKSHVVYSMQPWIMDFDQPDDGDFTLHVLIDDQWHLFTGFIG